MNTYEIMLMCLCCEATQSLGTVQADTAIDAKDQAAILWPEARFEEMYAKRVQGEMPVRSLVQLL